MSDPIEDIAAAYQVPVDMLRGPREPSTPEQARDMRKFYTLHNARLKGWKRRVRRMRALMSKMARKGAKR